MGNTITLPGGAVATVATITGGGATGPVGTATISNPAYHACANTAAGGLAQVSTSGGGTGATFTGTFIGPAAWGTRLLTRCYVANQALVAQAGGFTAPIGFALNGVIDYGSLDALFPSVRPVITTLYDQGIGGQNATNSAAYGPTISALRAPRGLRSIVFDGDVNGPLDSGAPNGITSLNLPGTLSINNQANTLVFVGGVQSLDHPTGLLNVGGGSGSTSANLFNKAGANAPNIAVAAGGTSAVLCPGVPYDRDNVVIGINAAAGSTCILNGVASPPGAVPAVATDAGGFLGYLYNGAGYAYSDMSMAMVVPWAMSAAETAALDASVQSTFGIQRQPHGLVAIDGDSDTDAHGSPAQHGWVRMFAETLGRPDIKILNAAFFGSTMGGAASNGAPGSRLTEAPLNIVPALDLAYAQNAANRWVLLGPMGNNDFNRGDTWLAANAPGTGPGADLIVPITPCPAGLACQQSDGLHPSPANDAYQAQSAFAALGPVLQ